MKITREMLFSAVLVIHLVCTCCVNGEYTKAEMAALAKFRPMVKNILLEDFMNADEYLINWLREAKLDLNQAKSNLAMSMQWRKDNKISTIRNEDFSKFRKEFPIFLDGFDKGGRPIMIYLFGFFNLRKLALSGQVEEFKRYMVRNFEEGHARIREVGKANVSQIIELYDLNRFNPRQHLCLQCLNIYTYFVQIAEANYPQLTYKTFMINVPTIFEQVMRVIEPFFSQHTKDSLLVFGPNKDEWSKALLKHIPKDQLFTQFGGTKRVKIGDGI